MITGTYTGTGNRGVTPSDAASNQLIVNALTSYTGGADDNDGQGNRLVVHALTSEGFGASEDGTGRGTPLVAAPLTASYGKQTERRSGVMTVRRLTPL